MSDWSDIYELWDDLEKFAQVHRGDYTIMAADNPGTSFGWVALRKDGNSERWWTITLTDMKASLPTRYNAEALEFQQHMKTAAGRRVLCDRLMGKTRPRTRWDRLMGRA